MQSILVTGANKGIGLAVVEAVLREHAQYRVIMGSRDLDRGNAACEQLLEATGANAERLQVMSLDVCDQVSVTQAATKLESSADKLYGLVNNAGIAGNGLAQMLEVNVYGMQRVSQAFMPLMTKGARVVNVTSASGPNYVAQCQLRWQTFFKGEQADWSQLNAFMQECMLLTASEMEQKGLPANAGYGLSKACANLLNIINARENPDLTINACTPGYIETDLTREMTGASGTSAAELGMKQPKDGARVITQLLFGPAAGTGYYFGSDALRSPLHCYRSPGSAAFTD